MFSTSKTVFRKLPAFKPNLTRLKPLSRRVSSKPYVDKYAPVCHDRHLLTVQLVRTICRHQFPSSPRLINGLGHMVWGVSVVLKHIGLWVGGIVALTPFACVMMFLGVQFVYAFVPKRTPEQMEAFLKEQERIKTDPEFARMKAKEEYWINSMVCAANMPFR